MARKQRARGVVTRDLEPISLTYDGGETHVHGEKDGSLASASYAGDLRPSGCNVLAHGTVKREVGYASRIVLTLSSGIDGGCNKPRQLLRRARDKFGFRLYPVKNDSGEETPVYTVSGLSERAIDYLKSKVLVWIDKLEETNIRLPGNGTVGHVARKPKRKRSSYHGDYTESSVGRAERIHHARDIRVVS